VGGGKGGVGKSIFAVNLGLTLAGMGKRCVLVDADLGGANLHTLLGLSLPKHSLSSLIDREIASLNAAIIPTNRPNLGLICGTQNLSDGANIKHTHKQKIIRQLSTIDADIVIVDLGAGSSFNVIDFFLAADESLIVTAPVPTAIENAYHFLRAGFFRRLRQATANAHATALAERALTNKSQHGIRTPRDLIRYIRTQMPRSGEQIAKEMATLRPKVILNLIRHEDDLLLCDQVINACHDYFGIDASHIGSIRNDERVMTSVQLRRPFMESHPFSPFSASIKDIALHFTDEE
jgi:flagellar biosynthesis protein FlhG